MKKLIYILIAIFILSLLLAIITTPNNPHPLRVAGTSLNGYWHLGTSKGCFEKGPYSHIAGKNFYSKIKPNEAPFLWGTLEKIKFEEQKVYWTFHSKTNGSIRKQIFIDNGNYLISEHFSIKHLKDTEFQKKNNLNGKIFLTSCGVLSWFNKLMITLRVYTFRKIRSDFSTYVD